MFYKINNSEPHFRIYVNKREFGHRVLTWVGQKYYSIYNKSDDEKCDRFYDQLCIYIKPKYTLNKGESFIIFYAKPFGGQSSTKITE